MLFLSEIFSEIFSEILRNAFPAAQGLSSTVAPTVELRSTYVGLLGAFPATQSLSSSLAGKRGAKAPAPARWNFSFAV